MCRHLHRRGQPPGEFAGPFIRAHGVIEDGGAKPCAGLGRLGPVTVPVTVCVPGKGVSGRTSSPSGSPSLSVSGLEGSDAQRRAGAVRTLDLDAVVQAVLVTVERDALIPAGVITDAAGSLRQLLGAVDLVVLAARLGSDSAEQTSVDGTSETDGVDRDVSLLGLLEVVRVQDARSSPPVQRRCCRTPECMTSAIQR